MLALFVSFFFAHVASAQTSVSVTLTTAWTDTGISVTSGQLLTISAAGNLDYNTDNDCPVGANCNVNPIGYPGVCGGSVPAPALNCDSLIGRIGTSGTPFQVGTFVSMTPTVTGELYLGVNDTYFPDNTGQWIATINQGAKQIGDCDCGKGDPFSTGGDPLGSGSGSGGSSSVSAGGSSGSDAATGFAAGVAPASGGGFGPRAGRPGVQRTAPRGPQIATGDYAVSLATGNLFYQDTDYATAGQNPLAFARYYNGRANISGTPTVGLILLGTGSLNGPMGTNWRSNFERYLQLSSSSVTAERPDGQQLTFTLTGGVWKPDTDIDYTLTNSGSTWTLTGPDDTVETYTAITSSTGLVSSIKTRNGYTQTLTYNSSHQLTSVADSYSRSLTIAYNTNGTLHTVTTPDSTTITYGYTQPSTSGGYNLTSVTYPTSPTSTLTYVYGLGSSQPNLLTGVTDEDGNTYSTFAYSGSAGQVSSSSVGGGLYGTSYVYNTGNTKVTNALGVADTYTFTTLQGVPKTSGISRAATSTTAAATESVGYDSNGYLNSFTDWKGNQTTYVNDSHGDPTTINEAVSSTVARTTTITYDPTWVHLPHTVVTPGVTVTYAYDTNGNVHTKTLADTTSQTVPYSTNGQSRTWTYGYTNYLLTSVQTPRTDVTAVTNFGYDSTGALTSITDALSHVTNITAHTGGGLPETIVDPNSVTTTLAYDARQRLTSSSISGTGGTFTTTYTVDPTGEITKVTYPDSSTLTKGYNTAHLLTSLTDILSNSINMTPDAMNDLTQIQNKTSGGTVEKSHTATFDALARRLTDVGGASQTTTYTYDVNGNALTVKDGLNDTTTRVFDALNRLYTSTDANSGVVTFTYDAHDRPLTVKDQNGNTTTFVYDGFGDVIQQASPDSGTTVYHYDNNGNLTSKTDALSVVTNQTFDKLDRVLTTAYPADSTENVAYTYDQTGTGFTFGIGRLTSLTDAVGSLTRTYDERGNLLTEKRTSGSNNYTTTYTYDNNSRIASITYPSGASATYVRDTAGRVTSVTSKPSSSSSSTTVASSVTYEPFGPVTGFTYGNSMLDVRTYDQDYRMTGVADAGSAFSQDLIYGYDAANNLKTQTDYVNGGNSMTYGYDVLNRLTSAVSGTGGFGNLNWYYDNNGNLTKISSTSPTAFTINYTLTTGTNRLATVVPSTGSITVSTNANGNITSIPPANGGTTSATYTYNKANRLSAVSGSPTAATFAYDAFGRRFTKTDSGSSAIIYTYGQDGALLEENHGGTSTDYIYMDGFAVATVTPSTSTYLYVNTDSLGVPTVETNSAQTIVWYTYRQPYGIAGTAGTPVQNVRFPGQVYDSETAFQYNGFRDYQPELGRYLEADPIGLVGGTNPYLYANASPVVFVDKLGTETLLNVLNNPEYWSAMYKNWGNTMLFFGAVAEFAEFPIGIPLIISGMCLDYEGQLLGNEPDPYAAAFDVLMDDLFQETQGGAMWAGMKYAFSLFPNSPPIGQAPPLPDPSQGPPTPSSSCVDSVGPPMHICITR